MSIRRTLFALATTAVALAPQTASAQFLNPGFELPAVSPGGTTIFGGGSTINGWTVLGPQVMQVSTTYTESNGVTNGTLLFNSHSGLASMDLTGAGNWGVTSGVQQSLATTIGQSYNLSFWLGKATGNGYYATPSTIDLSINGGTRISFSNSNNTPDVIDWQQFTYGFVATGASTEITFFNGTASSANNFVGLDDVSISNASTVVPEPATVVLLAAGLACVAGVARRRTAAKV